MDGLTIRVTSITITTPDPRALAAFYSRLLDAPITTEEGPRPGEPATAGWAQIRQPEGPSLNFEYEREWTPPTWPSEAGAQHATQHLDVHVSDLTAATDHAVESGATLAAFQPQEHVRVLFDPHNHPFCLFT
jgi:hypothetical protein